MGRPRGAHVVSGFSPRRPNLSKSLDLLNFLAAGLLLIAASSACLADVYKCVQKNGSTTFSDIPCVYDANAQRSDQTPTAPPAQPAQSAPPQLTAPAQSAALPVDPTDQTLSSDRSRPSTAQPDEPRNTRFRLMAPVVLALIVILGLWLIVQISHTKSEMSGPKEGQSTETATPSVFSFSVTGRIGRLRYLAFSWATILPMLAVVGLIVLFGGVSALAPSSMGPASILLVAVALIAYFWTSLRVMVLRLHDLNRSGKWVLGLFGVSCIVGAIGGVNSLNGIVIRTLIWIGALLLMLFPGSRGENDYGAPPGANSFWVFVGALIVPVTLVFVAIRAIRLPH